MVSLHFLVSRRRLIANFFPHFVHGISGRDVSDAIANPPGRGLSTALRQRALGAVQYRGGLFPARAGKFFVAQSHAVIVAFIGFAAMALNLSFAFAGITR